jgi:hypothetical protein
MIDEKKMIDEGFKFKVFLLLQAIKGEPYILDLYFNAKPNPVELEIVADNNKAKILGREVYALTKPDTGEKYYKLLNKTGKDIK